MRQLLNGATEIVVDQDHGFVRRQIYETALGRSEDMLARMAASSAVVMRAIACVSDCIVSASMQAGIITAWAKVPGVKITGRFKVVEGGKVLTPDFWSREGGIEMSLPWAGHPAMNLYFVVTMDRPNSLFRMNNSYIIGSDSTNTVKGWLKPPLANLYGDGRICMGHEPVKCCPTISDQWLAALNHFNAARFNTDLSAGISQSTVGAQIKFDASNNKQLPVPDNWHQTWARTNSTIYANLQ